MLYFVCSMLNPNLWCIPPLISHESLIHDCFPQGKLKVQMNYLFAFSNCSMNRTSASTPSMGMAL